MSTELPPAQKPLLKLFKSCLIKDYAMSHKVDKLINIDKANGNFENSKYLVIAGKGHHLYGEAIPKRILEK